MEVTVTHGIRVCHDGEVHRGGESVEVPESVAQQWIRYGWASTDGPSSLPDPRGLGKAHAEPDAWSIGVPDDKSTVEPSVEHVEPVQAKSKTAVRRAAARRAAKPKGRQRR